jgi:hypothetical protein
MTLVISFIEIPLFLNKGRRAALNVIGIIRKRADIMEGSVAIVMIFSIPLVAIITSHLRRQTAAKQQLLETELEKMKHENYIAETQKMKVELEQMRLNDAKERQDLLLK